MQESITNQYLISYKSTLDAAVALLLGFTHINSVTVPILMCDKYIKVVLYTIPQKQKQEPHGKGKI